MWLHFNSMQISVNEFPRTLANINNSSNNNNNKSNNKHNSNKDDNVWRFLKLLPDFFRFFYCSSIFMFSLFSFLCCCLHLLADAICIATNFHLPFSPPHTHAHTNSFSLSHTHKLSFSLILSYLSLKVCGIYYSFKGSYGHWLSSCP